MVVCVAPHWLRRTGCAALSAPRCLRCAACVALPALRCLPAAAALAAPVPLASCPARLPCPVTPLSCPSVPWVAVLARLDAAPVFPQVMSDVLAALPAGVPLPLRPDPPAHLRARPGEAGPTGFPSPAADYVEASIDLNRELIPAPLSTFLMRVCGDAMRGDGVVDGDLLVIDRSLDPHPGQVVVATHAGRFLVRRLVRRRGQLWLLSSDGRSEPLPLPAEGGDPELWGVVIHAVHHLRRGGDGRAQASPAPPRWPG